MKVLCWNLGVAHGRWAEDVTLHERSWRWIETFDPDLAFLQEVNPPAWATERWNVVTRDHEIWASALVARQGLGTCPIDPPRDGVLDRATGYHAFAELVVADGSVLTLASVHTPAREAPPWGYRPYGRTDIARQTVGAPWWNDVAFAGLIELLDQRRFLIAGDWNTARYVDGDGIPEPMGAEFFTRATAAGWVEVSLDAGGREGRSWYGTVNLRAYQPDHVFADPCTAARVASFQILDEPVRHGLSDHAPLVVELALAPVDTLAESGGIGG